MAPRNSTNRILRKSQGAITIFDLLPIYALVLGILCGAAVGSKLGHGHGWGGVGGIVGGILGLLAWRTLLFAICRLADRIDIRNRTTEGLQAMLRNPNCKRQQEIILELGIRGEKMDNYIPVVLDLLISPSVEARKRGWFTLVSVYPARAKIISDYRYSDPLERCREKVLQLVPISL